MKKDRGKHAIHWAWDNEKVKGHPYLPLEEQIKNGLSRLKNKYGDIFVSVETACMDEVGDVGIDVVRVKQKMFEHVLAFVIDDKKADELKMERASGIGE